MLPASPLLEFIIAVAGGRGFTQINRGARSSSEEGGGADGGGEQVGGLDLGFTHRERGERPASKEEECVDLGFLTHQERGEIRMRRSKVSETLREWMRVRGRMG